MITKNKLYNKKHNRKHGGAHRLCDWTCFFTSILTAILFVTIGFSPSIQASTTRANLLTDIGSSAQMIGIGNVDGFTNGSSVIFENPAGLRRLDRLSTSLFSTKIINEVSYTALSTSGQFEFGSLGIGYFSSGVSDIPHTVINAELKKIDDTDEQFMVKDSYSYKESLLKLSYSDSWKTGTRFKTIDWGASFIFYSKKFWEVSGKGFNMDIGAKYRHPFADMSLTIRNILPFFKMTYNLGEDYVGSDGTTIYKKSEYKGTEALPMEYVFGLKKSLLAFDFFAQSKFYKQQFIFSFGSTYRPYFLPYSNLSMGYKEFFADARIKRSVVIGLGLSLRGFGANFAFEKSDHVEIDNKSYFSIYMNIK